MKERDMARTKAQTSKSNEDWAAFRLLRNHCNKLCKLDKTSHFKKLYQNHDKNKDIRSIYHLTKSQLGWRTKGPPSALLLGGKMVTSPKEIADAQNDFFIDKVDMLRRQLPRTNNDPLRTLRAAMESWDNADNRPSFTLREITLTETVEHIKSLGNSSSFGHNHLDAMSLKLAASHLHIPLNFIINFSISKSQFANKWKIGRLVPIHKGKGLSESERLSFRPISLLSVTAKIVERVVQKQTLDFMESTMQLNQNNNAYRKYHSTTSAVIALTDALYEATDRNHIATIMTIDETCAFDCVEHVTLLEKMILYKFSESTINWFSDYLKYRS